MRRTLHASLIALLTVGMLATPAAARARTIRPRSPFLRTADGRLVAIPSSRGARLQPTAAARGGRFVSLAAASRLQLAGRTYGLSVQVLRDHVDGHADTMVFISIARGTGSAHHDQERFAVQEHSYETGSPANAFTWSHNLATARIDTGVTLGRWGAVRLRFAPSGDVHTSCGGATSARKGRLVGSFTFTPRHDNGVFGTIHRTDFGSARLWDTTCTRGSGGGGHGGTAPCPTQPTVVDADMTPDAHTFESLFVSTTTHDGVLAGAVQQQFYGAMSVDHDIFTLGYPSVHVHDDGTNVRIHAGAKVGLSGDALFRPTDVPHLSHPRPCGDGQQVVFSFTNASVESGGRPFTAQFDTGSVTLPSTGVQAEIEREAVTAAP